MRRPGTLPALGLSAALLLGGCAAEPAATPASTARCGDVEFPTLQFGSHLIGDAQPPIPYSSVPPTSGWHASGAPPIGAFDRPLSEPAQVLSLEAGGVVVTYNGLDTDDLATLTAIVEGELSDRTVSTSYDAIDPGTVVLASWGAMQRCEGLDVDALRAYVAAYGSDMTVFEDPTG